MELSLEDFKKIRDLVYEKTGMRFEENKMYFVKRRLEKRMEALGMDDLRDYYRYVKYDPRGEELATLVNLLTTNETYFFRDFTQLKGFAEEVLPVLLEEKRKKGEFTLRIWSAGCSTGEEVYTLAIIAYEMVEGVQKWDVKIVGSDINTQVLKSARRGVYGPRSVKNVPREYLEKYFIPLEDGMYKVVPLLQSKVHFCWSNLVDKKTLLALRGMDAIFCRNVLIYFDKESRRKAIYNLYDCLAPGGYLFLGHSEMIGTVTAAFRVMRFPSCLVYKKELAPSMHEVSEKVGG